MNDPPPMLRVAALISALSIAVALLAYWWVT